MLLLVGLGNPGEKYARHRHNVGFMAVDAIAEAHNFGPSKSKFQGVIREGSLQSANGAQKALALKPTTFMNDSGRSVLEAARFYKIPLEEIFVFYDELDLAPGKLKAKIGGGAAGHNGIRSIDAYLGNGFVRIRIGIGHPGAREKVTGHVLGNFSKADEPWLARTLDAIAAAAPKLCDSHTHFLSDTALQLNPPREKQAPSQSGRKPDAQLQRDPKASGASSRRTPDNAPHETPSRGALGDALNNLLNRKD